jgi:hypothetical protein
MDDLRGLGVLPEWLQQIARPEFVREAFERRIPEFAGGIWTLDHVEGKRLRIKQDAWTATYELTVESDGEWRTLSVRGRVHPPDAPELGQTLAPQGKLGEEGWRCVVPELRMVLETNPPDAAGLPALPLLTDPERARQLLEDGIRTCAPGYADIRIKACEPRVARYKPGSRCTLVYRLEYAPEDGNRGWPDLVVAKTYSGEKGRNAWDGMRALWDSELGKGAVVSIAEPLAFLPDLNVLVQGPVHEEIILKDLLKDALKPGGEEALERYRHFQDMTAAGLAALHSCGVDYGDTVTWEDEIAEIREVVERLSRWVPSVEGFAASTLARLEALAEKYPGQPAGPAHRSFRPAQVLIHQGKIGFIDFDGFCQAEPAIDVALYRATVRDVGMRGALTDRDAGTSDREAVMAQLPVVNELCDRFEDRYAEHAPISRERVALWEALDLLTNVLHNWTKVRPERLEGTMVLLERHLEEAVWPLG